MGKRIHSISGHLNQFFCDKKQENSIAKSESKDDINNIRSFQGNPSPNFGSQNTVLPFRKFINSRLLYRPNLYPIANINDSDNLSHLFQSPKIPSKKLTKNSVPEVYHMPSNLLTDESNLEGLKLQSNSDAKWNALSPTLKKSMVSDHFEFEINKGKRTQVIDSRNERVITPEGSEAFNFDQAQDYSSVGAKAPLINKVNPKVCEDGNMTSLLKRNGKF